MAWFIWDEYGIEVSESSISRLLKSLHWSKKVVIFHLLYALIFKCENKANLWIQSVKAAAERNQEARDDWYKRLSEWRAEQLIFVDESAANERTMDRKYGWAPIGKQSLEIWSAKRSERWSMLSAYTLDGYIAWEVRQASYTTVLFNEFICNHVLPLCNPYPGPRSIIVMDNAQIHRSEVLVHAWD